MKCHHEVKEENPVREEVDPDVIEVATVITIATTEQEVEQE